MSIIKCSSVVYNANCNDELRHYPDKFFKLAILDPPYFSSPEKRGFYGKRIPAKGFCRVDYPVSETWMVPGTEYFDQVIRISENQIIWGCNYYDYKFGPGRIIWDKVNYDNSFSDCEIAFCSLHDSVRLVRYMWNGMLQGKSLKEGHIAQGNKKLNEKRIHPTQKPVLLYKWLLSKYANEGDNILDTHVGSGSSRIACFELGYDFIGYEIDPVHWKNQEKRFLEHKQQLILF